MRCEGFSDDDVLAFDAAMIAEYGYMVSGVGGEGVATGGTGVSVATVGVGVGGTGVRVGSGVFVGGAVGATMVTKNGVPCCTVICSVVEASAGSLLAVISRRPGRLSCTAPDATALVVGT